MNTLFFSALRNTGSSMAKSSGTGIYGASNKKPGVLRSRRAALVVAICHNNHEAI